MREKKRVVLFPGWESTIHHSVHKWIADNYNAELVKYGYLTQMKNKAPFRKGLIYLKLLTISFFVPIEKIKNYLNVGSYKIGHSIIQTLIAFSEFGVFKKDKQYRSMLYEVSRFIVNAEMFFKRNEVILLVGGDDPYYEANILAQMAIKNSVPNIFIKGRDSFDFFEFDPEFQYAGIKFENIKSEFDSLNIGVDRISHVFDHLKKIEKGEDIHLYMKKRDFKQSISIDVKGKPVIYLHDFFDAPGVYGSNVFNDHYSWVVETVNYFNSINVTPIIKYHPNQREVNKKVIEKIKAEDLASSSVIWMTDDYKLSTLVENGICGVITVYGSVIYEAAICQIPIISVGRYPGISFNLTNLAKGRSEYFSLLKKLVNNQLKPADYQSACACFYMLQYHYKEKELPVPYDDYNKEQWAEIFGQDAEYPNGIISRRDIMFTSELAGQYVTKKLNERGINVIAKERLKEITGL